MSRLKKNIGSIFPKLDMSQFSIIPLLEDFFEGIVITDTQGRVLFVNEEQERIDGFLLKDISGQKVTQIYHIDDGISPTMQCLKKGKPLKGIACYYRTYSGKMVNSIHNLFPLFENNKLIGSICFIQDFSIIEQRFDTVSHPRKTVNLQQNKEIYGAVQKRMQFVNGTQFTFQDIIGDSREFSNSVEAAKLSARSRSPVMLFGETGTGKELFAQSIHNKSSRSHEQYIAINCAAIPENLLEGILFGTAKGAFTGAVDKEGLFEKANGGTLFLDEINSMTVGIQAKLLRFLQDLKIRRVGSLKEIDIDIKIISSVNQNPHTSIENGTLRSDIFYRLAVVFIRIPPLRERLEDLSILIQHFINKNNYMLDKKVNAISGEIVALFEQYNWPGNVRELEHVIEGAMNMINQSNEIMPRHLPHHLALLFKKKSQEFKQNGQHNTIVEMTDNSMPVKIVSTIAETKKKSEIHLIKAALTSTSGRPSAAARMLGISPQLINFKLKRYKINRFDYLSHDSSALNK